VSKKKISRRDFLTTTAGASLGLFAGLKAPNLLADPTATPTPAPTNTPLPIPQGAAGKLTVIHKTEYFEAVQKLFREDVV
jgi:multiple sugar transport system substrate-binding protein